MILKNKNKIKSQRTRVTLPETAVININAKYTTQGVCNSHPHTTKLLGSVPVNISEKNTTSHLSVVAQN